MAPTAPALPAGASLGHSYEYGMDVNLGTTESPNWQPIRRISDFQPTPTPVTQSVQSYDDFGAQNNAVTAWNHTLSFGVLVNRLVSTGKYMPEVEVLIARTRPSSKGEAAIVEVRWYHKPEVGTPDPDDAGQGFFTVAPQRANIGADGLPERLNFTLNSTGPTWEITNPFTGWDAAAPTVSSITPDEAVTGDLVTITGTGFVGTTTVAFGTMDADFVVSNDATLVASVPADSAGEVDVVVTNATGPSSAFSYTRGA